MIIDAHSHMGGRERNPEWWWESTAKFQAEKLGITLKEAWAKVEELWDWTGDRAVRIMDRANVDIMVICCLDSGLVVEGDKPAFGIEKVNQCYFEAIQRHPSRLVMGVGVDPRRSNAIEILERGVKTYGARTLKLYPPAGFYPNDPVCFPLYKKCLELGIPVNFHTGPIRGPFRSKYSHPMHFDDVAAEFPELTIHATHTGHGLWHEMVAIARNRLNIVCDIAGWMPWMDLSDKVRMYQEIRWIMDMLGPGRLMFASDLINGGEERVYIRWVKAFTEIPKIVQEAGIKFTKEELSDFMGGTAAKVLRLRQG